MSQRFLANENIPLQLVEALEQAGCDVIWIRRSNPGASDPDILAQAAREQRVLLTFDKDFGELAKASPLPPKCSMLRLSADGQKKLLTTPLCSRMFTLCMMNRNTAST
jgi:predicted nuclease of predicted toxin-antitoxin system